jgi:hypothetical protein
MSSAMARALRQALHRAALVAKFPVAVVDGGHRAGAHDPLEVIAFKTGDFGHRLLQRDLHLGQRRDRHPGGQVVVEHVVLAHIGVGQDIIAKALGCAGPRNGRASARHAGAAPRYGR